MQVHNRQGNQAKRHRDPNGGHKYTSVHFERKQGIGSKIGNSLVAAFMGPVIIIVGCVLLWYNEGWAIRTHYSLNEALENYVGITDQLHTAVAAGSRDNIPLQFEDKLVHLTGQLGVDDPPVDHEFGVKRDNSLSLSREVEIYQWIQASKKHRRKMQNGETEVTETFSYDKKWVNAPVSSDNFRHWDGHENFGSLPYRSQAFESSGIKLESLYLSSALTRQIQSSSVVPIDAVKKIPAKAQLSGSSLYFPYNNNPGARTDTDLTGAIDTQIVTVDGEDKVLYTVKATGESFSTRSKALEAAKSAISKSTAAAANNHDRMLFKGEPSIGDVRITFKEAVCSAATVLAQLTTKGGGGMLAPWPSKQGHGYDIGILTRGHVRAEEMLASAQSSNTGKLWLIRLVGWFLTVVGFSMVTQIISTTADISLNWIPWIGPMALSIINLGVTIANLVLGTCISLPVVAVAWIVYRPLLGVSLLLGSIGLFFASSKAGSSKVKPG